MLCVSLLLCIKGCHAGHLKAAGEFELEREAEACRAALAERQTAAAAVLQAAAEQAEALGFSEALALATNVRPFCPCVPFCTPPLGAIIAPKPWKCRAVNSYTGQLTMLVQPFYLPE